MAKTAEELFKELCTEAGMDEATTNALTAAAKNDKISARMNELIRRATDDFNAMQGRVKSLEKTNKEFSDYSTTAYQENQRLIQELEAIRNANTNVADTGLDMSRYLTKEDLIKLNQERDNRYSAVIKDGLRLASRHAVQYGEELDVDQLETFAREQNLPLAAAYDRWVQPRVEAKRVAEAEKERKAWEEKLKQAREEGVRDALSRRNLPVDPTMHLSMIHRAPNKSDIPADIDSDLYATWEGAATK
jgi:hypothetical protein